MRKAVAQRATIALDLNAVADRWWLEVGQHHVGSDNTWRDLCRLVDYFKPGKLITDIRDSDVAQAVAWRRGHTVHGRRTVSNATVNRSVVDLLRKIFHHAAEAWGVRFEPMPNWRKHRLREPTEIVRELVGDEWERILKTTPTAYKPLVMFAQMTGFRMSECLLRWDEVDFDTASIVKLGKGGELVATPVTSAIVAVLWPLLGQHPTHVFTRVARRTQNDQVRGKRYPLTTGAVKCMWRRVIKKSGVKNFRFHDLRHDFATKLLREVKDIKIVQKALSHRSLTTTARYAHVQDDEVRAALEQFHESREKSRKDNTA